MADNDQSSLIGVYIGTPYGILQNQFFSFDPKFKVYLIADSSERVLRIERSNESLTGFFGEKVSEMIALVGKNGVGKSTALRYIKDLFIKENQDSLNRENDIILIRERDIIKVFIGNKHRDRLRIINETDIHYEVVHFKDYPKILNHVKNLVTIFYSNSLEKNFYDKETTNFYNLSTGFLKENIGKVNFRLRNKRLRIMSGSKRFGYTELKRQLDFLNALDRLGTGINIPFKKIDFIYVDIRAQSKADYGLVIASLDPRSKENVSEKTKLRIRNQKLISKISKVISDYEMRFSDLRKNMASDEKLFQVLFYENLFLMVFKTFIGDVHYTDYGLEKPRIALELIKLVASFDEALMMTEILSGNTIDNRTFETFILSIERYVQQYPIVFEQDAQKRDKSLLIEKLRDIRILESMFARNWDKITYRVQSTELSTTSPLFSDLFDMFYTTSLDLPFMTFRWPSLSAGEESLISCFSRWYSVLNDIRHKNALILIDEGDLYFHPEWQRDYIYFILEFLNSSLNGASAVQIILTTHSPFIISDLPKENIRIMLKPGQVSSGNEVLIKEMESETFGGNLYSLFSEAFFLGDSPTSSYARKKIKEDIIQPIEGRDNFIDLTNIERLIQHVGEPVLRNILLERFQRRING
ncbi:MAG: AAA family ATPase [Mucilaginibacter sp.]